MEASQKNIVHDKYFEGLMLEHSKHNNMFPHEKDLVRIFQIDGFAILII
jgi:hypothetical protein